MAQPIVLSGYFEDFIEKEVSSGRYHSADEVVSTALRLLEEEEHNRMYIRTALEIGEESGMAEDFNAEDYLQQLHSKHL